MNQSKKNEKKKAPMKSFRVLPNVNVLVEMKKYYFLQKGRQTTSIFKSGIL